MPLPSSISSDQAQARSTLASAFSFEYITILPHFSLTIALVVRHRLNDKRRLVPIE